MKFLSYSILNCWAINYQFIRPVKSHLDPLHDPTIEELLARCLSMTSLGIVSISMIQAQWIILYEIYCHTIIFHI